MDPFQGPVSHFGAPGSHFDFAGGAGAEGCVAGIISIYRRTNTCSSIYLCDNFQTPVPSSVLRLGADFVLPLPQQQQQEHQQEEEPPPKSIGV